MTKQRQVYVCLKCGNMVEVLRAAAGTLTCCNQPMALAEENTTDAAREKHVPVVERGQGKVTAKVGSVAHPMQEDHYIEWVEIVHGEKTQREFLQPGAAPEATFDCPGGQVTARAYCNLHGLWKAEG